MTPEAWGEALAQFVANQVRHAIMIWGPPREEVGKSSVVARVAKEAGLGFVDVRLSQLAPTDLRGPPVPDNGISRWSPTRVPPP